VDLEELNTTDKMNLIQQLKKMGIAQSEIEEAFRNKGLLPPSKPTIRKYYNMDESVSIEQLQKAYAKEKAFDEPRCKEIIIKTLEINTPNITISSIYDLLQEKLIDTNILEQLPGNEQTLRNYCKYLKEEGLVIIHQKPQRIYDEVQTPIPGVQMQLDYGVQKIRENEFFHFIALLLRHSRFLYIKAQDHCFNAKETCNAVYGFFLLLGGRLEELVIDQDACLVVNENYGEIITTQVFKDFLLEQDLKLFVCRKADPESKGAIENTVRFVKQNYLPSRMDWSLQELISSVPNWCKRKNSRIHATELWKIDEHFAQFEKEALRPLIPSQYDAIGTAKTQITVSNTRKARYQTNKYTFPRDYYKNRAWYTVTPTKIMFYEKENDLTPLCTYNLPSPMVKNQTFEHEEYKKSATRSYRDIYDRILKNWHAKELRHFLNGLHKEHENSRYLRDQFKGFENMLQERKPSQQELEDVMSIACKQFRYKLSQLTIEWDNYLKEQKADHPLNGITETSEWIIEKYPNYSQTVETRNTDHYSLIFNSKTEKA